MDKIVERVEFQSVPEVDALLELYNRVNAAHVESNEPYKVSDATEDERREVKRAFIAGEIENPQVSYPHIDPSQLAADEQQLFYVLDQGVKLAPGLEEDLFYEKVARKLGEVNRHREIAHAWRPGVSEHERHLRLMRATQASIEVFGEPDQSEFEDLLFELRGKAADLHAQANGFVSDTAQGLIRLTQALNGAERTGFHRPELHDDTMRIVREDLYKLFAEVFQALPKVGDKKKYNHEETLSYFRKVMEIENMTGWQARLVAGNSVETNCHAQTVEVGRDRSLMDGETILLKAMHEPIGHGKRWVNGKQSEKQLLHGTFPDYLDFEEGFCVALEHIVSGKRGASGKQFYIGAGLLLGLDRGGEQRDFRQTYEIMWRRAVVETAAKGKAVDVLALKSSAYQICMRLTRGGAPDMRDLSYYRGYSKAVDWFNAVAQLSEPERFKAYQFVWSGKFDPTNNRHAAYVRGEGV